MLRNNRIQLHQNLIVLFLILAGLIGCRQSTGGVPIEGAGTADGAPDVQITLARASMEEPVIGSDRLLITLLDGDGSPITDAAVTVRGDMNHAGMVPVDAVAGYQGNGVYQADIEWTMAGDWIVTITAELADGRVKTTVSEFSVSVD